MQTNFISQLFFSFLLSLKVINADISEFGFHELDEYNDMIGCLSSFKEDFVQCNRNIKKLGQSAFNVFHENSTVGKMVKCCGIWMLRDCWKEKAIQKCPKDHILLIHKMPYKLLPMLHNWCNDYRDDSFACKLPYILPISLVVLIVIIACAIISCVIFCSKSRRTNAKYIVANNSDNKNNNDSTDTEV
jgi:hypothetical protein